MIGLTPIWARFASLLPHLDERERRLLAAREARLVGYGGIAAVVRATGVAASTIGRVLADLAAARLRDPLRVPAAELAAMGHKVSRIAIGKLLRAQKFNLQGTRKTEEGAEHEDRDAQFQHINKSVSAAMAAGQPVSSIDTKEKESVGPCKNNGRTWRPQGSPEAVKVQDFPIKEPKGEFVKTSGLRWLCLAVMVPTLRRPALGLAVPDRAGAIGWLERGASQTPQGGAQQEASRR